MTELCIMKNITAV